MTRSLPLTSLALAEARHHSEVYVKAATATLIAAVRHEHVGDAVHQHYRDDKRVELLTRASVSTSTMASLDEFTQTSGLSAVSVLGPSSAGLAMLDGGIKFTFENNAGIYIANLLAASGNASFIAENTPVPVRQVVFDNNTLKPTKIAVITTFSREVLAHSVPTIETMIRTALADSVALTFDGDSPKRVTIPRCTSRPRPRR